MIDKCPGQDRRNLKIDRIVCASCGYEMEIFSDELRVRCYNCKKDIYRQRHPSCIDWCKHAKDCIGEKKWEQLKGGV